jgi:hypothetical protein
LKIVSIYIYELRKRRSRIWGWAGTHQSSGSHEQGPDVAGEQVPVLVAGGW